MKLFAAYKNGVRAMAEKANLIFRDKGRARRSMKKYGDDYIIKEVVIVEKETYNLLVERLEEANELIRNAREAGYEFPDPDKEGESDEEFDEDCCAYCGREVDGNGNCNCALSQEDESDG